MKLKERVALLDKIKAQDVGEHGDKDVLITTNKGNKLTKSEWDLIKEKGIWKNPKEYMDYVDGWAKPNAKPIQSINNLNLGIGSNKVQVPANEVVDRLKSSLQDPELTKFYTKNDWDFENLGNLQGQLDSEYRKNDAGFNMAIGNLGQNAITNKGIQNAPQLVAPFQNALLNNSLPQVGIDPGMSAVNTVLKDSPYMKKLKANQLIKGK